MQLESLAKKSTNLRVSGDIAASGATAKQCLDLKDEWRKEVEGDDTGRFTELDEAKEKEAEQKTEWKSSDFFQPKTE